MFSRILMCFVFLTLGVKLRAQTQKPAFLTDYNNRWVDSVFQTLTLEEKIGQLLMPRGNYSGKPHDVDTLKKWVKDYKIGGLVFFASNPTTQAIITNKLQSVSKVPLLIGQDFEWGVGMRLDSTDRFPYAVALGAIDGNDELVEAMGAEVARQCKRIGVHINYAPVVDVNNNPNNPVINFRSYGSDRDKVTAKGLAYMKGMQSRNLLCTAKHFPGHGDTDVDSHHDLPIIVHDKQRLLDLELFPFKTLIDNGLSGIMTAHLEIPSLEPAKGLASTFSSNVILKLLREELKFQGLTFTDAMEMQGAVKNFPKGEAMVRALLAGNDVLETFMDVPGAVAAIKDAVLKGRISMNTLNFKVRKILMAKSWVGLDQYKPIDLKNLVEELNTISTDVLNCQLTERSITCLKNDKNFLPIKDLKKKIAVLSVEGDTVSAFSTMVNNYVPADYFYIPKSASDTLISRVFSKLTDYDMVLAAIHLVDIRASKKYGLTGANTKIIAELALKDNVILCILGNPFILGTIPELSKAKSLIMSYQQNKYTENVTAQIIFGAVAPSGRLPVGINSDFKLGMGVFWNDLKRLTYGVPEQVGIDRIRLSRSIDSLMYLGINEKAFPGGVVQIAKDGKVIFTKGYGYQTYEDGQLALYNTSIEKSSDYRFIDDAMDNPVSFSTTFRPTPGKTLIPGKVHTDHIYDLASVTKISTSTLAVMQLMSENKFSLDSRLKDYFPAFENTNKSHLIMKDLLTHRAGLMAWIPFWKHAVDTVATMQKALVLNPELEKECIIIIKKPGFFKRIFGKKPTKEIKYIESLATNASLWLKILTPETRTWKSNIFSSEKTAVFNIKVDEKMYLNHEYIKTILYQIATSPLNTAQGYLYSDLHYYLYPEMIKKITGLSFENYLNQTFISLGASSLCFNPTEKFRIEKIVPTEYDSIFRQQLIHGYVHDEGAALMGGVSGHAGLFGNANDLTKLMQMYLQQGYYGGIQYINPKVLEKCTSYQFPEEKNRRGIGFDKKDFNPTIQNAPVLASPQSYGHSGFTGTYVWIDPKYNLVYIFLSNRVYPTRNNNKISTMNIRTEVGNQIIKAIMAGK
jgi:beta-glucosidase-like glycosyl hydrolase/CubicO group peptidase (beta-lactamase class C family)